MSKAAILFLVSFTFLATFQAVFADCQSECISIAKYECEDMEHGQFGDITYDICYASVYWSCYNACSKGPDKEANFAEWLERHNIVD